MSREFSATDWKSKRKNHANNPNSTKSKPLKPVDRRPDTGVGNSSKPGDSSVQGTKSVYTFPTSEIDLSSSITKPVNSHATASHKSGLKTSGHQPRTTPRASSVQSRSDPSKTKMGCIIAYFESNSHTKEDSTPRGNSGRSTNGVEYGSPTVGGRDGDAGSHSRRSRAENRDGENSGRSTNGVEYGYQTFGDRDDNAGSHSRRSRAENRDAAPRLRSASQGLRNLGNTCYMNCILQCLAKVPWGQQGHFKDQLLNEFFGLMSEMQEYNSDDPINPAKFRKQIDVLGFRFSKSDQNDAHEFLVCLLSRLKKNLIEENSGDNIIERLLLGKQRNVIKFENCDHDVNNTQSFFTISLPIILDEGKIHKYNEVHLIDCLEHYTRKETMDGDALCLECQKMDSASIQTSFTLLPKILIIHLKRYEFQTMTKLENKVLFPVKDLCLQENGNRVLYDLFGVCNHFGSLRFGHYTADIKSASGKWHNYSDSSVSSCSSYDSSASDSSRDVYILFYERRKKQTKI